MERYELTSLQIRDMVSYVHHSLWVIVDQERKSLVFLVDYGPPNRKRSKSYEVWQRFVSQSRRSPFINHQELARLRRSRGSSNQLGGSKSQENSPLPGQTNRFFTPLLSVTDAFFPYVKRGPFYMLGGVFPAVKQRWKEHGLYGCLGFEVRLADVVGLNYLNELQTDGCLAMEATRVEKREFGDLNEAVFWYSRGGPVVKDRMLGVSSAANQRLLAGLALGQSGALANGNGVAILQSRSVHVGLGTTEAPTESASQRWEARRETNIPSDSSLMGSALNSRPATGSLTPDLSAPLADIVHTTSARVEQSEVMVVCRSEADGPLLLPEIAATSPTFHSAQASPAVAGPCFEETSTRCEASCSVIGGGRNSGLVIVDEATVSSCKVEQTSSNGCQVRKDESCVTASILSLPGTAATESPAPGVPRRNPPQDPFPVRDFASETREAWVPHRELASESQLTVETSQAVAVLTEGCSSKVVVQASSQTAMRSFRRQRSRSLDAPRLRAVLDRVAEQAARAVAFSPGFADVRTLEAPPPLSLQFGSTSARIDGAETSTGAPSIPPFPVTAARISSEFHGRSDTVRLSTPVTMSRRRSSGRPGLARTRSLSEPDSLGELPRAPLESSAKPSPIVEVYTDRLVMFRFRDPRLPAELKGAITTDQRLLKMLESGLPTWAIFVQSYPALCHVYRPWMRRISGYLYFVVSAVTVLIGFYDLYKNLPFVQDSLHRLFGPLYDWVEQWQMGARLGYLGTVLFLQNFQKAFRGAQGVFRSLKYLSSVAFRPVLVPFWVAAEWFRPVGAGLWGAVWETGVVIGGLGSALVTGVWYAAVYVVSPVISCGRAVGLAGLQLLFPIWTAISAAILFPLTLLAGALSALAPIFSAVGAFYRAAFTSVSPMFATLGDSFRATASLAKPVRETVVAAKAATRVGSDGVFRSLWLSLYSVWSDLFWTVFGAVRRIVFGFLAFILEINKHRLSTYNHVIACLVEAENATWQCVIDTKEIILKIPARFAAVLTCFPVSLGRSSEGDSVFLDARDHFDEERD